MIDAKGRFVIEDYRKKSVFSGFLPGISGIMGIPMWCYYVNRGQCISCFGSENKDNSIMEFVPAHQAYVHTGRLGYRTFIRMEEDCFEAFTKDDIPHTMYVDQNTLSIEERDEAHKLTTAVTYFTLPEEKVGALVRKVTFTNTGKDTLRFSYLDGCPAIVPFGISQDNMKNMTQTAKAWMQVEDVEECKPYFRVRASLADSTKVTAIEGGNFSVAVDNNGTRLQPVVDCEAVFAYDTSYAIPHVFVEEGIQGVLGKKQMTMNQIPCCFYGAEIALQPQESYSIYQITGHASNKELFHAYQEKALNGSYFEQKLARATELTRQITDAMDTKTANPAFDAYCRQNFLDNVLRGGMPIRLGEKEIFYVYARKHGDMERDYNYFRILPEYYSQGNGNFRDINQNRRCDARFYPMVKDKNMHTFYDFIQLDGYNPLGVEKTTYKLTEDMLAEAAVVLACTQDKLGFLTKPFTPGSLAAFLNQEKNYEDKLLHEKIGRIVDMAESLVTSDFLEGYWVDHWTYNLDLIENYLSVYPEDEHKILYEDRSYVYMKPGAGVLPRVQRYAVTEDGIRQYKSVYHIHDDKPEEKLLCDVHGKVIYTTLMEKLVLLNILKFTTLDPYGCGIDMEGGKPGWYDALNGLPGLLGSSTAETCELARNLEFTMKQLNTYQEDVLVLKELQELMKDVSEVLNKDIACGEAYYPVWDGLNTAKEQYREKIYKAVSGEYVAVSADELTSFLGRILEVVKMGMEYAVSCGNGLMPTYFTYQVTSYENGENGIVPIGFKQHTLPYFLEGPVRYMKLSLSDEEKKAVYDKVRKSALYDEKLSMYKVNAPLAAESFELGRCRAFTPGWLENESIWLHMEYKYLLELLKSGLYQEYIEDFYKAVIPFQPEERYGRSILENSSFLASSANPDEKIHGKGFVARLSGSTVEFMDMWQTMMFGQKVFRMEKGELVLGLEPLIPAYLLGKRDTVEAVFLGKTKVIYHVKNTEKDYIPGEYKITEYRFTTSDGRVQSVYSNVVTGKAAQEIRNGGITKIEVYME